MIEEEKSKRIVGYEERERECDRRDEVDRGEANQKWNPRKGMEG